MVLIGVVLFAAILSVLATGLMQESSTQIKLANRAVMTDQAFYVAEAGGERAVAYIMNGGAIPGAITGAFGNGKYMTIIMAASDSSSLEASKPTISGSININPNDRSDNEFLLVKPNGETITRDDLVSDTTVYTSTPCVFYTGPALLMHIKPKGTGNQNTFFVDGTAYPMENANSYDFRSLDMDVNIYNDSRNNLTGRVNGDWHLGNVTGTDVDMVNSSDTEAQSLTTYSVLSVGIVKDARRLVIINGLHQQSWAKYALWYDIDPGTLIIATGEQFFGPVHANCMLKFLGSPEFFGTCTTASTNFLGSTNAVIFHQGFDMGVTPNSMASINFSSLQNKAGMVVTGMTSITFTNSAMRVTNAKKGWNNTLVDFPSNGLIYVKNPGTTGASATQGIAKVAGVLDGRITIAADYDIYVTNHLRYAVHPTNGSDDALGLLTRRDFIVASSCPNNVDVFAHIMATGNATVTKDDGSFWVQNYNTRSASGGLNVFGGIIQNKRGPVGTVNSQSGAPVSGYSKNYIYDTRFASTPPPYYPTLTNEYEWASWREKSIIIDTW